MFYTRARWQSLVRVLHSGPIASRPMRVCSISPTTAHVRTQPPPKQVYCCMLYCLPQALGVLLFVLAFGKLPFQGDSKLSILFGK